MHSKSYLIILILLMPGVLASQKLIEEKVYTEGQFFTMHGTDYELVIGSSGTTVALKDNDTVTKMVKVPDCFDEKELRFCTEHESNTSVNILSYNMSAVIGLKEGNLTGLVAGRPRIIEYEINNSGGSTAEVSFRQKLHGEAIIDQTRGCTLSAGHLVFESDIKEDSTKRCSFTLTPLINEEIRINVTLEYESFDNKYTIRKDYLLEPSLPFNMSFRTDKDSYPLGEKINLSFNISTDKNVTVESLRLTDMKHLERVDNTRLLEHQIMKNVKLDNITRNYSARWKIGGMKDFLEFKMVYEYQGIEHKLRRKIPLNVSLRRIDFVIDHEDSYLAGDSSIMRIRAKGDMNLSKAYALIEGEGIDFAKPKVWMSKDGSNISFVPSMEEGERTMVLGLYYEDEFGNNYFKNLSVTFDVIRPGNISIDHNIEYGEEKAEVCLTLENKVGKAISNMNISYAMFGQEGRDILNLSKGEKTELGCMDVAKDNFSVERAIIAGYFDDRNLNRSIKISLDIEKLEKKTPKEDTNPILNNTENTTTENTENLSKEQPKSSSGFNPRLLVAIIIPLSIIGAIYIRKSRATKSPTSHKDQKMQEDRGMPVKQGEAAKEKPGKHSSIHLKLSEIEKEIDKLLERNDPQSIQMAEELARVYKSLKASLEKEEDL